MLLYLYSIDVEIYFTPMCINVFSTVLLIMIQVCFERAHAVSAGTAFLVVGSPCETTNLSLWHFCGLALRDHQLITLAFLTLYISLFISFRRFFWRDISSTYFVRETSFQFHLVRLKTVIVACIFIF